MGILTRICLLQRFEDPNSEPGSDDKQHEEDSTRLNSVWVNSRSNNYFDERDDNATQFLNERNMYGNGGSNNNNDSDIIDKSLQSEYRSYEDVNLRNSPFERQQKIFRRSGKHFISDDIHDDAFHSNKKPETPEKQYGQFDTSEGSFLSERQNGQLSEDDMTPEMQHDQFDLARNPVTTKYYGDDGANRRESEGHVIYRNKYAHESSGENGTPGVFITGSKHDHNEDKINSFAEPNPTSSHSEEHQSPNSVQRNPSSILDHFVAKSRDNFNESRSSSVQDFQEPQHRSHSQVKQLPAKQQPWTEGHLNDSPQAVSPKDASKWLSSVQPGGNKPLETVVYNSEIEHISQESRGHPDGKPVIHLINHGSREKPYRNNTLPPLIITETADPHGNTFTKSTKTFVDQNKVKC